MVFKVNRVVTHEPTKMKFSWVPRKAGTYPIIFDAGSPNEASTRETVYINVNEPSYGPSNIELKDAPRFVYENKANVILGDIEVADPNEDDVHVISLFLK